jgi:ribosome-associated protein
MDLPAWTPLLPFLVGASPQAANFFSPRTLKKGAVRHYLRCWRRTGSAGQEELTLNRLSPLEANISSLPPLSGAEAPQVEEIRAVALECLEDMKAENTVEIDLTGKTSIADTMIVTSGRSDRHVGAIAERVLQALKDKGFGTARVEGMPACDWVLIDAGDVLIHIFRPEVRGFYNLEKMWGADRPHERAQA